MSDDEGAVRQLEQSETPDTAVARVEEHLPALVTHAAPDLLPGEVRPHPAPSR